MVYALEKILMRVSEWFLQLFVVMDDQGWTTIKAATPVPRRSAGSATDSILGAWAIAEALEGHTPWRKGATSK